jgi:hypothetical protein
VGIDYDAEFERLSRTVPYNNEPKSFPQGVCTDCQFFDAAGVCMAMPKWVILESPPPDGFFCSLWQQSPAAHKREWVDAYLRREKKLEDLRRGD